MTTCALLLCIAGGTAIYLASRQQTWLARSWPATARWVGALLCLGGLAAWIVADGGGVGTVAALSSLMLTWVSLPYLAWWRRASKVTS